MLQVVGAAAAALVVGAHRYSNSNAVLVGAVELNAYWLLGTTEGTATERAKKQKKRHTSKKKYKGAKANTPVTAWPLDDSAQQQEHERPATKLETTNEVQLYKYSPAAPVLLVSAPI